MTENTVSQFNELRLLLEANVASPGIVVVTSAKVEDGTKYAAFGLADSLAASGHRTLLLQAADDATELPASTFRSAGDERRLPRKIGDHGLFVMDASDYRVTPSTSRDGVDGALAALRAEYGYVIVNGGVFPKRPLTGLLASLGDATLIALRSGRSKSPGDATIANAIELKAMNVLGVVATSRKAIEAFEALDLVEHVQKPRLLKVETAAASV